MVDLRLTDEHREIRQLARTVGEREIAPVVSAAEAMVAGVAGSELFDPEPVAGRGIRTRADLDGDTWVLRGQVGMGTNGGAADAYIVFARTDLAAPPSPGRRRSGCPRTPRGSRSVLARPSSACAAPGTRR